MRKSMYDDIQCQDYPEQTIYFQPFFVNTTCAFDYLRINLIKIYEIIKHLIAYHFFLIHSFCEHFF